MNFSRLTQQSNSPFSKVEILCAQLAGYKEQSEKFSVATRVNPVIELSFFNKSIAETAKQKLETADLHVSYLIRETPIAQKILNVVDTLQMHMAILSGYLCSVIQLLALGTIADHMGRIFHRINEIASISASEQFLIRNYESRRRQPQGYIFPYS